MAIRILLATVVGAVLAFGWGAFSWTSGLYDFAFRPMPGGSDAGARLAAAVPEDGAYLYPAPPSLEGMTPQQATIAQDAFLAEHRSGPLVMAVVRKQGIDPESPTVLVRGFAIELFAAGLLAAVFGVAAKFGARPQDRLALALLVPLFAVLATHGVIWNFFHLPDGYSIALFVDGLVTWALASIACAVIVRPSRS
jgi:hypothetical protein